MNLTDGMYVALDMVADSLISLNIQKDAYKVVMVCEGDQLIEVRVTNNEAVLVFYIDKSEWEIERIEIEWS